MIVIFMFPYQNYLTVYKHFAGNLFRKFDLLANFTEISAFRVLCIALHRCYDDTCRVSILIFG